MTGDQLKAIRTALALTQSAFAKELGVSGRRVISWLEAGDHKVSRQIEIICELRWPKVFFGVMGLKAEKKA